MKLRKERTYCAGNYVEKMIVQFVFWFVIVLLITFFIGFRGMSVEEIVIAVLAVVILCVFRASFLTLTDQDFETVTISEDGITVFYPEKWKAVIQWNESVSVEYRQIGIRSVGGAWVFDLILSSAPLPDSLCYTDRVHFSPERFEKGEPWRVSIGRGSKRWCRRETDRILSMKAEALRKQGTQQ